MADAAPPCVFCEIVAGRAPAYRVFESERSLVILDIQPFSRGHCLVLSKRHAQFWHELEPEENASLFSAAQIVADRMMRRLKPDFVCMYARGRRIAHTHVFLVPSFGGDVLDRFFNALEGFQESPDRLAVLKQREAMEEVARQLRDQL
ncbi:MAG: HIT family protein [Thermoanaerobaculaceae bacterium]